MIKNAIVYRAQLPDSIHMIRHLQGREPRPLQDFEAARVSFATATAGGISPAATFHGGYWIRMQVDEKVVPASIVKQETDKEVERIKQENGIKKMHLAERTEIKERVYLSMLETALVKTSFVRAYYHVGSQLLFVDTPTKKRAGQLLDALIKLTESVKTTTIHISDVAKGITTRLHDLVAGVSDEPFGPFTVRDTVKLVRTDERITFVDYDVANSHEIQELLVKGFEVAEIKLDYNGHEFKLTGDFKFKGFTWSKIEDTGEDEVEREINRAFDEVVILVEIIEHLCGMMEYTLPEAGADQGDGEPPATEETPDG